jgi:hypothetical protein
MFNSARLALCDNHIWREEHFGQPTSTCLDGITFRVEGRHFASSAQRKHHRGHGLNPARHRRQDSLQAQCSGSSAAMSGNHPIRHRRIGRQAHGRDPNKNSADPHGGLGAGRDRTRRVLFQHPPREHGHASGALYRPGLADRDRGRCRRGELENLQRRSDHIHRHRHHGPAHDADFGERFRANEGSGTKG